MGVLDPNFFAWAWLVAGLLLLGVELLSATTLLLWPGLGAMATGLVLFGLPGLPLGWQITLFGAVAVLTAIIGRKWFKQFLAARPAQSQAQGLNTPETMLIGKRGLARPADAAGRGSIILDGQTWVVRLPSGLPPQSGQMVQVVALDGGILVVEPVEPNAA